MKKQELVFQYTETGDGLVGSWGRDSKDGTILPLATRIAMVLKGAVY